MAPDLIDYQNSGARSQPSPLDDVSLSSFWSSKSSIHNDPTHLLDKIREDGGSPVSQELLVDSSQQSWKAEFEAGSASDNADNLTHESNAGCFQPQACSIKAHEAKDVLVVPLMKWNEVEASRIRHTDPHCQRKLQKESIMRKITIGFGIGNLLQHVSQRQEPPISNYSCEQLQSLCSIDNFAVESINETVLSEPGWEVTGVHMITPFLSVKIDTNCSLSSCSFENEDGLVGRNVAATIISTSASVGPHRVAQDTSDSDCMLCHLLGVLLHFLFSASRSGHEEHHGLPKDDRNYHPSENEVVDVDGPPMKKKSLDVFRLDKQLCWQNEPVNSGKDSYPLVRDADFFQAISIVGHGALRNDSCSSCVSELNARLSPLKELGYPASLSQLVANLVDCGSGLFRRDDSYPSLDVAINDMKILLQEPQIFLFPGSLPKPNAFICSNRLYGRSNEVASLTNAYCRVATSGVGEAIFVGGFSGCGKTRLVHSIFESVNIAGGYAVTRKFDEMQSPSSLSVVLSAFNELCILVAQKSSQACRIEMYEKLSRAIGTPNLAFLTRILPNALHLLPSYVTLPYVTSQVGINFHSLCFTIQHLMRVISRPSMIMLLFLDDLQWADAMSLKILQSVISDVRGFKCTLFIGGFRENEVEPGHVLFEFFGALSTSEVLSSMLHLNGISKNDVNSMISETLGVLPRLCKGLSDVVFRKTNGNPFFTLEFLRSLIARDLVQYSLRDKSWEWDLNQISSENITENVLHLLTKKLSVLSEANQTALKVASCFGSIINVDIVRNISSTAKYSSVQTTLDATLVKEGFLDFDGMSYRFVHDKVREAAYGLIVDKEQYHFDLGIALHCVGGDIFSVANQINRGPISLLQNDAMRPQIVDLNYKASLEAMNCSDFTAAYSYINTAVSILPNDSWASHYDLTLKCYFQLAKAAYSCGQAIRAQQVCEEIIERGKCLEDTIETHSLFVSMICLARKDLPKAFKACLKVLNLLGEDIPDDVVDTELTVKKAKMLFQNRTYEDFLAMVDETNSTIISIMEFYNHLVTVSFQFKPRNICQYFNARWASFCLTHRVACKYTPGAFVSFASVLSRDFDEDATLACKISKTGMTMLSRNDSAIDQLPGVYAMHYMIVGSLTEPIQSSVAMSQHAYEIGMQTGNLSHAAFNLAIMMARSLYAGTNLLNLKNDVEVHMKSAKQHSQLILLANLVMIHEVVSKLIGVESTRSFPYLEQVRPTDEDSQFTLEMFSSFYHGHTERVHYKSKLWERLDDSEKRKVPIRFIYTAFFSGISSFRLYSHGRRDSQYHIKNLAKSLSILDKASRFSEWNYKNKYLLLKAASLSISNKNLDAENEFNAAILASKASKFLHEEGLACELAAFHHLKQSHNARALSLFHQAKSCYKSWGSHIKELQIISQIELIK